MKDDKTIKKLRGIRNDFRKVDFQEYEHSYNEELRQDFVEGRLGKDTPIETLRGLMYGYTFSEEYRTSSSNEILCADHWPSEDYKTCLRIINPKVRISEGYQHQQIINTLLSSGDGCTPETAFCVINTHQEYELMDYLFCKNIPEILEQRLCEGGIDQISFKPNDFGVEKLYFDIHRRFDVGYPMDNDWFNDADWEWEILEDDLT